MVFNIMRGEPIMELSWMGTDLQRNSRTDAENEKIDNLAKRLGEFSLDKFFVFELPPLLRFLNFSA